MVGFFCCGLFVWGGFLLVCLLLVFVWVFLCVFFLLLLNCYHYISHFIYYTDLNDEVSTILKKHLVKQKDLEYF